MKRTFFKLGIATIVAVLATISVFAFSTKSFSDEAVDFASPGSSGGECPAVDPLDHTVLLPDPFDCSMFYSCSNGVPILMFCPDGLHFNAELDVCDWPQEAGCDDGLSW